MKRLSMLPLVAILVLSISCKKEENKKIPSTDTDLPASNPFAKASTLPFQAPDFSAIKNTDFKPAIEAGMKQQLEEIDRIANNPDAPTFENTLVTMEKSGQLLKRANPQSIRFVDAQHIHRNRWLCIYRPYALLGSSCRKGLQIFYKYTKS